MLGSGSLSKNILDWRIRAPIWLLAMYFSVVSLKAASGIFIWIISSVFLFIILDPLVKFLSRKGIPAIFAALAIVGALVFLFVLVAVLVQQNTETLTKMIVDYKNAVMHLYDEFSKFIANLSLHKASPEAVPGVGKVTKVQVINDGTNLSETLVGGLAPHVGSLAETLAFFFLCPVLTFFFFAERSAIRKAFAKLILNDNARGPWWKEICQATRAYFLGNLILAAASWPIFAVSFSAFGLQSWLLFSIFAAILNIIPFVGAPLAALLPILDHLAAGGGLGGVLGLLGMSFGIHFLIANLVTPKVLGSKVDLNAWISTIAIVAWGALWGAAGLLYAVPLTAILKISFQYSNSDVLQWLSLLMSDDPEAWEERSKLTNPIRAFRNKGQAPQ